MKRLAPYLVFAALFLAAVPAWAAEEEEVAQKFLGLPVDLWKLANLLLILGVLVYFLGRPFSQHFRKRRGDLDEAIDRAAAIVGAELKWSEERTRREIAAVKAFYVNPHV